MHTYACNVSLPFVLCEALTIHHAFVIHQFVTLAVLMLAVGTGGALGGVWRCPPLALAEFSTAPAELLNAHSLGGLRAMLRRGDAAHACLPAAVRAQALRAVVLEVSIRHNQVWGRGGVGGACGGGGRGG